MQTIDIHAHLLSSEVRFNRIYDRIALKMVGKKMGLDRYTKTMLEYFPKKNPIYSNYTKVLPSMEVL